MSDKKGKSHALKAGPCNEMMSYSYPLIKRASTRDVGHFSHMHNAIKVSSEAIAIVLNFDLSRHPHPNFVHASSEACMRVWMGYND